VLSTSQSQPEASTAAAAQIVLNTGQADASALPAPEASAAPSPRRRRRSPAAAPADEAGAVNGATPAADNATAGEDTAPPKRRGRPRGRKAAAGAETGSAEAAEAAEAASPPTAAESTPEAPYAARPEPSAFPEHSQHSNGGQGDAWSPAPSEPARPDAPEPTYRFEAPSEPRPDMASDTGPVNGAGNGSAGAEQQSGADGSRPAWQSAHDGAEQGQQPGRREGEMRFGRPPQRSGMRPGVPGQPGQPAQGGQSNGQPPRMRFDRPSTAAHGPSLPRTGPARMTPDQQGGRGRPGQGEHPRDRRPMQTPGHGQQGRPLPPQRGVPPRNDRNRGNPNRPGPGQGYGQPGYIVPGYGVPGYGSPYPGQGERTQRPNQQRMRPPQAPTPAVPVRTVEVQGVLWVRGNSAELLDEHATLAQIATLSISDVQRIGLRSGDVIRARAEERGARRQVVAVESVNNRPPESARERPTFEQLTAISPRQRITLEHGPRPLSARIIDLFAPLGFGARALVVAPPKTGKTTFLRETAESVLTNYPDVLVLACLVGERPEEVTDLRMALEPRGGLVYAASFDEPQERHAWLVQVTVERAKRVAEAGGNVVVLLDSLTRLARAENLTGRTMGRTLSGGIDAQALDTGRRAFGAARALEEGGSLTIMATCLVDTGSRQDDVVYEEFKGTGNMELYLSRELSQRRLFPAVDAVRSGTRKEELLLSPDEMRAATKLRRYLADLPLQAATTQLLNALENSPSNPRLIVALEQSPSLR
jgi:transcription termination factor Rho